MTYEEFKEWLSQGVKRAPSLYLPQKPIVDQKSKGAMSEVEEEWDGGWEYEKGT